MIRIITLTLLAGSALLHSQPLQAQVDEDQTGLWSMLFWNTGFGESRWGLQGDIQYRQWDVGSDLEQLLIRGGVTWRPATRDNVLFTLGYGNITSGEFGPSDRQRTEHRIYQEALISQRVGERLYLRHRLRSEQRWVENQDFRTRYRYALFADIPLNGTEIERGSVYLAFYNELFLNGEKDIGDGREVDIFDRNRSYAALGYAFRDRLKAQFGFMYQASDTVDKGQLQLSLHSSF